MAKDFKIPAKVAKFRQIWSHCAAVESPAKGVWAEGGGRESKKSIKKCYKDKFLDSKFNSIEWTAKELKEK